MNMPQQAPPEPHYLQNLNPPQREAVEALDGAVLVLAGAGTGKTRVLTTRLAHLISTRKAWPSQILAVTFTNKAAQEMKTRVASVLGQPVEGWWLGTFHSLSARMLRRHAELVGLTPHFTIIDPDDQLRLTKQILEAENIDVKKCPPQLVQSIMDRWKDKAWLPEAITADEAGGLANGKMRQIYATYQARLKQLNACDFGDLILHMITILRSPAHVDVLQQYHKQFRYILVDEYQDTNVAQYLWLRLLAQGSGNLCCVGDDDQSIYGWRGAEVDNILRFEKDFPEAKIIRLEQNYRSTGHILSAASAVIANNQGRLGKTLWSAADAGEKVSVRGVWDADSEARSIIDEVESLQNKKYSLSQMAILVRASFMMRTFEENFIKSGIPYRVIGGARFYERQEVRDALAYMRLIAQSADDLALERIINTPKRGIGDTSLQNLRGLARERGISLYEAIQQQLSIGGLRPKLHEALQNLVRDFERWRELARSVPHAQMAGSVLEESGYIAMWQAEKTPDAQGRVENLKEFVASMEEFESLEEFLDHVALVLENQEDTSTEKITLMTLHGAKGLEFEVVFLPGWEEGLFPSQRSMDENGIKGLEEERRLAYVALTRARKHAYVSFAANRRVYGNWLNAVPSRFIGELPAEAIESESDIISHSSQQSAGVPYFQRSTGANQKYLDALVGEASDHLPSQPPAAGAGFLKGQRVRHSSFGDGTVVHVDGKKLDIAFDDGELRRLMSGFVEKV